MKKYSASLSQSLLRFVDHVARKFAGEFGLGNSGAFIALLKIKTFFKKVVRPTELDSLDICVAEHCNLGCYSCNHFSQLADPEFADLAAT
ncbi:MAG: hypothetical protein LBD22_06520, partial [Spirochaetaceae bacterium]|nr:hypothetical protein [Spirochaetaceae bacterium]